MALDRCHDCPTILKWLLELKYEIMEQHLGQHESVQYRKVSSEKKPTWELPAPPLALPFILIRESNSIKQRSHENILPRRANENQVMGALSPDIRVSRLLVQTIQHYVMGCTIKVNIYIIIHLATDAKRDCFATYCSHVGLLKLYCRVHSSIFSTSSSLCVCVCVFIKLHITTQSGPVILVILCHSH